MDAERLIESVRRALAASRAAEDIVAEAWQAQCLAQAIGDHLAHTGPRELRGEARALAETAGRGGQPPDHPAVRAAGGPRAARLSGVADLSVALRQLAALLAEAGIALVSVACATDEEGLYWACVEATDAADEAGDRVRAMLHRLAVRERTRPPGQTGAPRDLRDLPEASKLTDGADLSSLADLSDLSGLSDLADPAAPG
ncbi:DUF6099 family protein [Streptomyces lichenis]|uniref:DUF6099 family protein n=1 Tax=Streptomyces lichenis TaxID=2306967 RepID=A0ABT0I415_9ACTN|nr:DUF6099 family protein [Streptomyces lichenis]MCK8676067.1 DUF6099 family protein [Streptomyces lichenis]